MAHHPLTTWQRSGAAGQLLHQPRLPQLPRCVLRDGSLTWGNASKRAMPKTRSFKTLPSSLNSPELMACGGFFQKPQMAKGDNLELSSPIYLTCGTKSCQHVMTLPWQDMWGIAEPYMPSKPDFTGQAWTEMSKPMSLHVTPAKGTRQGKRNLRVFCSLCQCQRVHGALSPWTSLLTCQSHLRDTIPCWSLLTGSPKW